MDLRAASETAGPSPFAASLDEDLQKGFPVSGAHTIRPRIDASPTLLARIPYLADVRGLRDCEILRP
eukprot:892375-Heterocapsa_arctica.AAC.1